jgi:N-dimethylarginine dimethylaminohydrolase
MNAKNDESFYIAPPNGYGCVMSKIPHLSEPPFESEEEQKRIWGRKWGISNDVGKIRMVLVKRPGDEMKMIDESKWDPELGIIVDRDRYYWRSKQKPDIEKLQAQHDAMVGVFKKEGVEVEYIENQPDDGSKSVYTRDPAIVVKGGAIIGRMSRLMRKGEERKMMQKLASLGMPILHIVHGTGIREGGGFAWINKNTAVVSLSIAGNEEGARQVEEVLRVQGVQLIRVPNTGFDVHIDGAFVMIDTDRAIIDSTMLPYWFLETLKELKIWVIEKHPDDGPFGVNCLALEPGKIMMASEAEKTAGLLRKEGIEVILLDISELVKGGGGIHCSTLPLIREEV